MRWFFFTLFAVLCALPAGAETVRVRSGEHADFSRLVFEFATPTEWELTPRDDGYDLQMARSDIRFDFSRVFRFIPRDRLAQISSAPGTGRVSLNLGCPCHAVAFETRPGTLVIDFKPGADPKMVAAPAPPAPAVKDILARAPLPILGGFVPPAAPPSEKVTASEPPDEEQIAQLQQMLLKELSRAAAQGMVEADIEPAPKLHPIAAPPEMPPAPALPPPTPEGPGIHIETSLDRANQKAPELPQTNQGAACLPDRYFDVAKWGGDAPDATLIAEARTGVVGEFDKVDTSALRHLVTTYLYLGFGAEARAALTEFDEQPSGARMYRALADILDYGETKDTSLFEGQLGCDAPVAFWAALAAPDLPRGAEINRNAIVATFSRLPLHLRRHLGPALAQKFLSIADAETATRLRNAIARAPGDHGAGFDLLEARLDLAEGHVAAAETKMADIAARDVPLSAEALLEMMEARIAEGRPPNPQNILSADALAFENQHATLGQRLMRVSALGSALAGDFSDAFEKQQRADPAQSIRLLDELFPILVNTASDADFLKQSFALLAQPVRPEISQENKFSLATRLLSLGFSTEAQQMLPPPAQNESETLRVLRGQIALSSGDARQALRQIAGLSGAVAEALRGEAYAALGNLDAAAGYFAEANETEKLAELAWQAGNWPEVEQRGTPEQQAFARARTSPSSLPISEPSLAAARNLLESSATTRAALANLIGQNSQVTP